MLLFHYFLWAVTINYHHLAASRSASVDDDEEEEDKLHAMLSMICSRNLTAPNRMKGFYPPPPVSQSSIAARSTDAYNSVGIITGKNISLTPRDLEIKLTVQRGWEYAHNLWEAETTASSLSFERVCCWTDKPSPLLEASCPPFIKAGY